MSTWTNILDLVYPVGSVYVAYNSTTPATRFGGTWTAIIGRFPYFNAGTGTGGANTVTLTVDQMPEHSHNSNCRVQWYEYTSWGIYAAWADSGTNLGTDRETVHTDSQGGGKAHNNMPAYQTLYAWRRTA